MGYTCEYTLSFYLILYLDIDTTGGSWPVRKIQRQIDVALSEGFCQEFANSNEGARIELIGCLYRITDECIQLRILILQYRVFLIAAACSTK